MFHILGKCLLFGGMTLLGVQYAAGLKRRISCLKEFLSALERLERELAFALLPVEVLLNQLSTASSGAAHHFFSQCETRFSKRQEECLEDIWTDLLAQMSLPLREDDRMMLQEIGGILGRYDGDSQRLAFQRIHDRLDATILQAKEESERMGKVSSVLGITLGLFFVIML